MLKMFGRRELSHIQSESDCVTDNKGMAIERCEHQHTGSEATKRKAQFLQGESEPDSRPLAAASSGRDFAPWKTDNKINKKETAIEVTLSAGRARRGEDLTQATRIHNAPRLISPRRKVPVVKITQPASILLPSPRITPVTLSRESARCKTPLSCDASVTSSTVPLRMSRPVDHEMRCVEKQMDGRKAISHQGVLYLEWSSECAACLLCKVVGRFAHGAPVYHNVIMSE